MSGLCNLRLGGPLKKKRHEAFCRFIAEGRKQAVAYEMAGFSAKGANGAAWKLQQRTDITARISELSAEVRHVSAVRTAIDRDYVLYGLQNIIENGKTESAIVRALELCGKELGMFVERREVTNIRTAADIPTAVLEEMREQARLEMEAEAAGKLTQMPGAAPAVEDSPVLAEGIQKAS